MSGGQTPSVLHTDVLAPGSNTAAFRGTTPSAQFSRLTTAPARPPASLTLEHPLWRSQVRKAALRLISTRPLGQHLPTMIVPTMSS
jgi:hypothetical protein